MLVYLETLDLWKVVEEDYEVLMLSKNPSMTYIKHHKEKKTESKGKVMPFLWGFYHCFY